MWPFCFLMFFFLVFFLVFFECFILKDDLVQCFFLFLFLKKCFLQEFPVYVGFSWVFLGFAQS